MTFDYIAHLTNGETKDVSSSEQWAGQYNWLITVGEKKSKADALRETWKNQYLQQSQPPGEITANRNLQTQLGLSVTPEALPTLDQLPPGSFLIHFTFMLQKPYISRDDNDFHIIDNPLVREKVFRWPMVRPSGWKGSLCHALWQLGHTEDDVHIQWLFGAANEKDDTGQRGRLYFYPTFFDKSSLEIINPHDRQRRVGKNPILLECVPISATGTFTLLYVPFDRIGEDAAETRQQVAADLQLVAEGIQAMLTIYGFGAKTSSGFGTADITEGGQIEVHYPDEVDLLPTPLAPTEPDSVRQMRSQNPDEDFSSKPNDWKKEHNATNRETKAYKDARADWNEYQKQVEGYQQQLTEWQSAQKLPPPATSKRLFSSFEALQSAVERLSQKLLKQADTT